MELKVIPIQVIEVVDDNNFLCTGFYFDVVERECAEPYGYETWGYLCDEFGCKYVYSLPIYDIKYQDGYLNKENPGPWYACAGGMGYNALFVTEKEMLRVLNQLGYTKEKYVSI